MREPVSVALTLPLRGHLLPLLQRCVEEGARAFGLDEGEALRLLLASEEVYAFLLAQGKTKDLLTVTVSDGGASVEVRVTLPDGLLPLEAFNLVPSGPSPDDARQGLFLASRTVSSLEVFREGHTMVVAFRQDRRYGPTRPVAEKAGPGPWRIVAADGHQALQLAARAASRTDSDRPSFVFCDGKAADLLLSGLWGAFAALNGRDEVGAGLFWERRGRTAFLYGPWSFADDGPAPSVLEAALGELARTDLAGVCLWGAALETPLEGFEFLGSLKGPSGPRKVHFRLLGEDDGGPLYVHPVLEAFVRDGIDALALPRAVQVLDEAKRRLPDRSALALRVDPLAGEALLSTLSAGRDGAENLRAHGEILAGQGIASVTFALDLGRPDEAAMGPCLVEAGFRPRLILPWAGRGDLLLFTPEESRS